MPAHHVRRRACAAVTVALLWNLGSAHAAAPYRLDSLTLLRNSTTIFFDGYDDGQTLPPGPNFPGTTTPAYVPERTVGNFSGAEHDGKLDLDPRHRGAATLNPFTGRPEGVAFQAAYLNVNTQDTPESAARGLKLHHTFELHAVFDLVTPPQADGFDSYGLRLADFDNRGPTGWNDVLDLQLFKSASTGGPVLLLIERDFRAGTRVQHGLLRPDPALGDQIELFFVKPTADVASVQAGYRLLDHGVPMGDAVFFAVTPTLFEGEVFTRPGFFAVAQVPEPSTGLLLGSGLLLLAWGGRSRRRAKLQPMP